MEGADKRGRERERNERVVVERKLEKRDKERGRTHRVRRRQGHGTWWLRGGGGGIQIHTHTHTSGRGEEGGGVYLLTIHLQCPATWWTLVDLAASFLTL